MFRDYEIVYLAKSLVLVALLTVVATVYETMLTNKSGLDIVIAVIRWQSVTLSLTLIILAVWEVTPVLAKRINEKFTNRVRNEGRREGRQEQDAKWIAWNKRRLEAERQGLTFNEPTPANEVQPE